MSEPVPPGRRPADGGYTGPVVVSRTIIFSSGGGRSLWGVLLALGIVALVFGVLVLANIWTSLRLVAVFAGIFLVFAGVVQLVGAVGARRYGARLVAAIVTVVAGVVVVVWPEGSLKALAILVGASFVVWGLAIALSALHDRTGGVPAGAMFGAILVIIGLVVAFLPGPTVAMLMALVGLAAILFGVAAIMQALAWRKG
jgi:uncharacterized membrane protein HdeD (DUF308 family)